METSSIQVHSEIDTGIRTFALNTFPGVDLIVRTLTEFFKEKNVFRKSSTCRNQNELNANMRKAHYVGCRKC